MKLKISLVHLNTIYFYLKKKVIRFRTQIAAYRFKNLRMLAMLKVYETLVSFPFSLKLFYSLVCSVKMYSLMFISKLFSSSSSEENLSSVTNEEPLLFEVEIGLKVSLLSFFGVDLIEAYSFWCFRYSLILIIHQSNLK